MASRQLGSALQSPGLSMRLSKRLCKVCHSKSSQPVRYCFSIPSLPTSDLSYSHFSILTMAKQQKKRAKNSSISLKNARQSAAKQAMKKRSKAPSRISKEQVVDATAQINSQFAVVQALYAQVCASNLKVSFPADWSISPRRPETLLLPCRKRLSRISRMS